MASALVRRFVAIVLALNLIGGAAIQFAAPAYALTASSAAADPCAQMKIDMQRGHDDHGVMPCNSMPCKGGGTCDCVQNCLTSCAPNLFADLLAAPIPTCSWGRLSWPIHLGHAGLSIKPDPFPPKISVTA
jgi:hypothetical protein